MTQIYRFDYVQPPALSEKMLKAKLERRKIQRQTTLLALAGILAQLCLFITALMLLPENAILSIVCFAYLCVALCGGGAIAIVFTHKRRNLIWPSQTF